MRTQEIFGYDDYPVTFTMFEVFGFGKPIGAPGLMEMPGVQSGDLGPAGAHGRRSPRRRARRDPRDATRRWSPTGTLEVAAGTIEAGTVGAVRFETIGVVDGRDAIVIEHVNRMASDLAPEWPTARRDGTYRIAIEGDPDAHL